METLAEIVLYDVINSSQQRLITELQSNGYKVHNTNKIDDLSKRIGEKEIEIFIINIHSEKNLINNIAELALDCNDKPLIVLSDSSIPNERVFALESGIFEFVTGPYLLKEVLIHVKRGLDYRKKSRKKINKKNINFDEFGDFIWHSVARELWTKKGFRIELTETEAAILEYFIRNPDRELSRDEIWYVLRNRERWPLDRTLDGHIARLRSKLQDTKECSSGFIKSVRGKGYVFRPFALFKSFNEMSAISEAGMKQISL